MSLLSQDDNELGLLRKQINRQLKCVLKIYFRLSQNMESGNEYFSIDFYRKILEENGLFDAAKMLDLAAIYGRNNKNVVQQITEGVLASDPNVKSDMKEAFDMAISVLKRVFKDALRADQMI